MSKTIAFVRRDIVACGEIPPASRPLTMEECESGLFETINMGDEFETREGYTLALRDPRTGLCFLACNCDFDFDEVEEEDIFLGEMQKDIEEKKRFVEETQAEIDSETGHHTYENELNIEYYEGYIEGVMNALIKYKQLVASPLNFKKH